MAAVKHSASSVRSEPSGSVSSSEASDHVRCMVGWRYYGSGRGEAGIAARAVAGQFTTLAASVTVWDMVDQRGAVMNRPLRAPAVKLITIATNTN